MLHAPDAKAFPALDPATRHDGARFEKTQSEGSGRDSCHEGGDRGGSVVGQAPAPTALKPTPFPSLC
jgi:hypothetical protein